MFCSVALTMNDLLSGVKLKFHSTLDLREIADTRLTYFRTDHRDIGDNGLYLFATKGYNLEKESKICARPRFFIFSIANVLVLTYLCFMM